MRKLYEALSVDVVKFEAQDVITASNLNQGATVPTDPTDPTVPAVTQGGNNNDAQL